MAAIEEEIIQRITHLSAEKQRRVLDFVRDLDAPQGIRGEDFIALAHELNFDPADLEEMRLAIEEGCERIELEDNLDPFI